MRIAGKEIKKPNIEILVIPRGDGEDIVFKAQAIKDMSVFDKLCPEPQPPKIMKKGGIMVINTEDPSYLAELQGRAQKRLEWMIIESLKATEGLIWEKVKPEISETWGLYKEELQEAGLSDIEINLLVRTVMSANCLDEGKLQEARERFLASQVMEQNPV